MAKEGISSTPTREFFRKLFKRKNPDEMIKIANKNGLKKTLGVFDLIMLGVGAIIGSGIFTVVGIAAAGGSESVGAGPALALSMVIAAFACVFSALCYSEFASMIPVAGSAYVYTYATMGEIAAWMIGWILMLEYVIGYIAVSVAWSGYFMQLLQGFSKVLPSFIVNPPLWLLNDYTTAVSLYEKVGIDPSTVIPTICGIPISINLPAICIILIISFMLTRGTKESTKVATLMVFIKMLVIFLFVGVGAFYVKPENWVPFAPNGFEGVFMGAFIIFFAYIGFDALSTTAEECVNPKRDLPIGICGSLAICTVIYIAVALVLTGMMPLNAIDLKAPIAHAMRMVGQDWVAGLISVGALAGLTSVLLVLQLGATRILYAMSRDSFLPRVFRKLHRRNRTPDILTWTVGLVGIFGTLGLDLNAAAGLCNFGTFTSFIIVCVAVLILRKIDPKRPRPFRVPFSPLFPILGILCCGGLMLFSMPSMKTSTRLFPIWLLIGVVIYFAYGYKKNRRKELKKFEMDRRATEKKKELAKNGL